MRQITAAESCICRPFNPCPSVKSVVSVSEDRLQWSRAGVAVSEVRMRLHRSRQTAVSSTFGDWVRSHRNPASTKRSVSLASARFHVRLLRHDHRYYWRDYHPGPPARAGRLCVTQTNASFPTPGRRPGFFVLRKSRRPCTPAFPFSPRNLISEQPGSKP